MNREICLVTWYDSINFGTCLQAFALSKILKEYGYFPYICSNHKYFYGVKHPIYTIENIILKLKNKHKKENTFLCIRKEKNHLFAENNNNIFIVQNRKSYYKKINNTYIFITGSDQIWNPNIVTPPFLLAMVKKRKDIKRIAYSSSIGKKVIPANKKVMYKKYLSLFNVIGVREQDAITEIENIVRNGIKVEHVLDPTLLIDVQIYRNLANHSNEFEYLSDRNYIICYFVGKSNLYNKNIKEFAAEYDCEVINIVGEAVEKLECAVNLIDVGVEDFLWLLLNAKYIVSDSFHASVFSLIFQKQFLIFKRFNDNDPNSQNTRIFDLLSMLKIPERLVDEWSDLKVLLRDINYHSVNQILNDEIENSKIFLRNAITNNTVNEGNK